MNISFHILKASGRLAPYIKDIEKACREAEKKITAKIPIFNIDVAIVDNPYEAIMLTGIGGNTHAPNFITIPIDPKFPNLKKTLQLELMDSLAHEFHHAARWQTVGYGKTLFEAIISEGLASHFTMEITGKKELHPWDKALSSKQIGKWLEKAEKEFDSKKYSFSDWFFGSKEKKMPKWIVYSLGFYLVKEYLKKHPEMESSTLYKTKAKQFI